MQDTFRKSLKIETVFKELLKHQLFKLHDDSEAQVHNLYFHQLLHKEYEEKKMAYWEEYIAKKTKTKLNFKLGASCSCYILPFFLQIFLLQF